MAARSGGEAVLPILAHARVRNDFMGPRFCNPLHCSIILRAAYGSQAPACSLVELSGASYSVALALTSACLKLAPCASMGMRGIVLGAAVPRHRGSQGYRVGPLLVFAMIA